VILAAGLSRRMGAANKLLAEVDGMPMLARVVDSVVASKAKPILVVTGHEAEAVRAALGDRPVTFVHNPAFAEGLAGSVKAGIDAVPPNADGAVVCLGDMPQVTGRHIDRLIAAFNPVEGRAICIPTWQGRQGNPVLWARRFFDEIMALSGDRGAKALIEEHGDQVAEVAVPDAGVALDIDTPEALASLARAKET
jgi:molybdenum cofactor cytidylyltransferase